jgi:long-subunit acyl-CoA synthetase (AMP-forming)
MILNVKTLQLAKGLRLTWLRHASSTPSPPLHTYKFLDDAQFWLGKSRDKQFLRDNYSYFSYGQVLDLSRTLSLQLKQTAKMDDLKSEKIGVYCSNNYSYLISILAIWMAGGVPFCLSKLYPPKFIEFFLNDSKCRLIINSQKTRTLNSAMSYEFDYVLEKNKILNLKVVETDFFRDIAEPAKNRNVVDDYSRLLELLRSDEKNKEAFLLYTSGTSGSPKGWFWKFSKYRSG